jgi:hypothetical protein
MAGVAAGLLLLRRYELPPDLRPLVAVAATAAPMLLWAVLVERAYHDPAAGLDWDSPRSARAALGTSGVKLVGLFGTWAVIAAAYALARPLHGPSAFAVRVLADLAPWLLPLSAAYVFAVDR